VLLADRSVKPFQKGVYSEKNASCFILLTYILILYNYHSTVVGVFPHQWLKTKFVLFLKM